MSGKRVLSMPFLILVSLLLGNASSKYYFEPDAIFDYESLNECTYTLTNNDSIVLHDVTLINGVLGYRVEYWVTGPFGGTNKRKVAETSTLLGTTLGYNPFANTATFQVGQLAFTVTDPDC